jgi:cell division septum initiation protein DivIVA
MPDKDVFNQETPPQNDEELVKTLVGEGKPYKSTADLAKGKLQADIHIKRVEQENKELRDKVASAKTVDDVLAAVQAKVALEPTNSEPDPVEDVPQGITAEQVAKIVTEQITGRETAKIKAQNKDRANKGMFELFGEKASEVFEREANTPELKEALIKLAEVDPDKFISMFKKEVVKGPGVDSQGSKKIDALNMQSQGTAVRGTQAYYSKLRRENPSLYYSAATQLEMHEYALKNPDSYFGRS